MNNEMNLQAQGENNRYKTLIYVSQAHETTGYDDAKEILNASFERNNNNNISGMLIYNKNFFVQALNGPLEKVDTTFKRIQNDTRHHTIKVLGEHFSEELEFNGWNMGFLPRSDAITEIFDACNVKEGMALYNAKFENMKSLLQKLSYYI